MKIWWLLLYRDLNQTRYKSLKITLPRENKPAYSI